jgi:hypothetical protein
MCDRTRVVDCGRLSSGDDAANVSVFWQPVIYDRGPFEYVGLGRSRGGSSPTFALQCCSREWAGARHGDGLSEGGGGGLGRAW